MKKLTLLMRPYALFLAAICLYGNLFAEGMIFPSETENVEQATKELFEKIKNTPHLEKYVAAYAASWVISGASLATGQRYLPPITLMVGSKTIPLKTLINLALANGLGYAPLLGVYLLLEKQNPPLKTDDIK